MNVLMMPRKQLTARYNRIIKRAQQQQQRGQLTYANVVRILHDEAKMFWNGPIWPQIIQRKGGRIAFGIKITSASKKQQITTHKRILEGSLLSMLKEALELMKAIHSVAEILAAICYEDNSHM